MKKLFLSMAAAFISLFSMGCSEEGTGWTPDMIPDDPTPVVPSVDSKRAPLYWTVYEYGRRAEVAGMDCNMPRETWQKNIDWVAENLLPYGYDMICTDGFMAMLGDDNSGHAYMTSYAHIPLTELISMCKEKGLRLGVYDNPLWVHGSLDTQIEGTKYKVRSLLYDPSKDNVMNPNATGDIFTWIVPSHRGAKEYIDGFFKYYKSIGVDFIRMDFMCLFETGIRGADGGGRGYGTDEYRLALQYIKEAADKYGVFTSLVMPNMKNHGENECQYGDMARIVDDTCEGGWDHCSNRWRGSINTVEWPSANNMFEGFTYWSDITGRGKIIPDGDFTIMHSYDTDDECRTAVTLQLVAGGPIAVADQYNTIGSDNRVRFYQNEELLALNADKFVGKPLTSDYNDPNSQIWWGTMTNGDVIVALFNREDRTLNRGVELSQLGISGTMKCRDLWNHTDEGEVSKVSASLPAHGCKIVRLTSSTSHLVNISPR